MSHIIDKIQLAVESFQVDGLPYYSYGTWNEEANRIINLKNIIAANRKKFPLVFLLLDIDEKFIKSERHYESDIKIFIINESDENLTPQERHTSELPTLRTIETSLLSKLPLQGIEFEDYNRIELFYPENKLNEPVNCIELSLPAHYC